MQRTMKVVSWRVRIATGVIGLVLLFVGFQGVTAKSHTVGVDCWGGQTRDGFEGDCESYKTVRGPDPWAFMGLLGGLPLAAFAIWPERITENLVGPLQTRNGS